MIRLGVETCEVGIEEGVKLDIRWQRLTAYLVND